MSLSEFVNSFFLLLNFHLVLCCGVYPHICTYKFICKYTQFCGDTCLHMYHENKHFMKVNWYINNSDTVSFSSRRQSDSAMERQSRRRNRGRGAGGMQWMGMVSHKFTSSSNLIQVRGAWTGVWCFPVIRNDFCSRNTCLA